MGHEESGKARQNWTPESYARDVISVIDEIEAENLVLIGHDMGDEIILIASRTKSGNLVGIIGVDNFKNIDVRTINNS